MATPTLTRHTLPGVLGPIAVDVRTSERGAPQPAVLILPGFKGFKDWGMFPILADRVARAGFSAVSINVSGAGVDGEGRFVHPERFGHNTFSAELDDVRRVLDALEHGQLGMARTSSVGLVGHSRGGGMAILTAGRDPRVHALVTWAAISTVDRWPDRVDEWREAGKLEITNARTGDILPLYVDVLDDAIRHRDQLDIAAAAGRVTAPWLLLHGSTDPSVPLEEARVLSAAASAGNPPRLIIIEGAGHTLGAVHPYAGMTPDLAQALDETLKWLGRYL